jgi:hypothetical protein
MSAIRDGRMPIELEGKEYHMLFSLNVMDEVEDRIGNIDKLSEVLNGKGRMKIIKWLFTMLLNEGMTEGEEPLTEQRVGKLIHGGNFKDVQNAIYSAFVYGNRGTTPPDEGAADNSAVYDGEEDEEGKNGQSGRDA